MSEGKIIEYIEQGKLLCTLCLQDKGTRLHLLTLLNRLVNLPSKRATYISSFHISILPSNDVSPSASDDWMISF